MESSSDDDPPHDDNAPNNHEVNAPNNHEDEFKRGATAMKKVIRSRNKGMKFEVIYLLFFFSIFKHECSCFVIKI